ncbi:MAG TPA: 7-carboxy-7-deazaguanine synthase [Gemmatimonadales bacterium]|nr:7-carboxy-7-deazaguanine synthase [Gemmatimonadales bacterium]
MSYAVKELFYTLQGEGANAGRAAVFCRFAGCNLWTGREADRARAVCTFCDTDFVGTDGPGGGRFATAAGLAAAVRRTWDAGAVGTSDAVSRPAAADDVRPLVVCTGGEPLLQVDAALIDALHAEGFAIAVETNGTRRAPAGLDWICVSPKAGAPLVQTSGDELKLVFPQREPTAQPERFAGLAFTHFFLQPMDVADPVERERHRQAAVAYCLAHPRWRLSLQTHKLLGIP